MVAPCVRHSFTAFFTSAQIVASSAAVSTLEEADDIAVLGVRGHPVPPGAVFSPCSMTVVSLISMGSVRSVWVKAVQYLGGDIGRAHAGKMNYRIASK